MPPHPVRATSLPAELAEEVESRIREHPDLGYSDLEEFVHHAVLDKLRAVDAQLALRAVQERAEAHGPRDPAD